MQKRSIAILTPLPADLETALADTYDLLPVNDAATGPHPEIEVAITTAMRGFFKTDLERLPRLKLVLSQGVGLDKLDLAAATEHGVDISVTPNILTEDVADFAIGLTYATARNIALADRFVRAGRWGPERIAPSISLVGKTMGIAGMGRIGRAIATRATALGMGVAYTGRAPKADLTYIYTGSLTELAAQSDILVLAVSGGAETLQICNADVLATLGPSGILINISRGSVVDEAALLDALESRRIAAAGLDVFTNEPRIDQRFLQLDNVVLTPHSASITKEVRAKLIACLLQEAGAYFANEPLKHVANRDKALS